MLVAVDVGHGWVKAISGRGDRCLFPALIHPAPVGVNLGAFGTTPITRIDGEAWLIGDAAERWATPLWSRDKATDDHTRRLLLVAAARLGAIGPVSLATGLPLAWFGAQHRAVRQALTGVGGVVQLPGGRDIRLWFDSVLVLPQGVAAAGPVLDAADPGPYLIVDVGERTTDYIIATKQPDGALEFDTLAAGSLEWGMHHIHQTVADTLSNQYGTHFTAAQVANEESLVVRGQRIVLTDLRQQEAKRLARVIVQELLTHLDQQMDQVLGIIAVGGGGALLAAAIPGVTIPDDPQWANAQGYMAALIATAGQHSAEITG